MIIRKATQEDLQRIAAIYDEVHTREEAGEVTTGWIRNVYPVQKTAEDAISRNDMFVQTDETGVITAAGIINQVQADVYKDVNWVYPAREDEVMVLHTLVVSVHPGHRGSGKEFLEFYEAYALEHGCKYLQLDTNVKNKAARDFYQKHGYHEIGTVPTVFNGIPGVDLVLLEKRVGQRSEKTESLLH